MTTSAEQMRAWRGPAILTYGFRPFFFGAGVWAALAMPRMIIAEATLAYLGLGMKPVSSMNDSYFLTSWGQIISEGRTSLNSQPWVLLTSAICIALIVVAVTFFGNGLRDAVDPQQRGAGK